VGLGHSKHSKNKGKTPKQTDAAVVQVRAPSQSNRQSKGVDKAKAKGKENTKESK
jgi:hypothetical protein